MTAPMDQDLWTAAEVIEYLRLDSGRKRPQDALRVLRRTGRLFSAARVGREFLYRRVDVVAFATPGREETRSRGVTCAARFSAILHGARVARQAKGG